MGGSMYMYSAGSISFAHIIQLVSNLPPLLPTKKNYLL